MVGLLLNPDHSRSERLAHAILPTFLASTILFIWASFSRVTFLVLSTAGDFYCPPGAAAWTVFAWAGVTALGAATLRAHAFVVRADPGAVPARVAHAYRGLARAFAARQYPGEAAAAAAEGVAVVVAAERAAEERGMD